MQSYDRFLNSDAASRNSNLVDNLLSVSTTSTGLSDCHLTSTELKSCYGHLLIESMGLQAEYVLLSMYSLFSSRWFDGRLWLKKPAPSYVPLLSFLHSFGDHLNSRNCLIYLSCLCCATLICRFSQEFFDRFNSRVLASGLRPSPSQNFC